MSYLQTDADSTCDYNYLRYAGWSEDNYCIKKYFSKDTVRLISKKVTELTKGVDPKNRSIIVPDENICKVMDGVFQGFRPAIGDIFTRYIIPNDEQTDLVQSMIDQTIEIITNHIRGNIGIDENNFKLSAWVQVYGDFNPHNLTQTPPIKILGKRPATMQFNMNY